MVLEGGFVPIFFHSEMLYVRSWFCVFVCQQRLVSFAIKEAIFQILISPKCTYVYVVKGRIV